MISLKAKISRFPAFSELWIGGLLSLRLLFFCGAENAESWFWRGRDCVLFKNAIFIVMNYIFEN